MGNALRQYAGAKQKQQLINLLSPVSVAAERSALIKDLLETGDTYHPLAWTPGEAYQFVQELLQYEAAGLTVRLPDWWKKRPRPQVSVKVGQKGVGGLNAQSLLDFDVSLTLGGKKLSPREWEQLMAADEGLVLLQSPLTRLSRFVEKPRIMRISR